MINYATSNNKAKVYTIDRSKRNVLLIGKAETSNKNKVILNPINLHGAKQLYGDSILYNAYAQAYSVTNDSNIYTVNCQLYTDFIEIIDSLVQYNFDFIVPLDIYLRDTFINPISGKETYFFSYYLERLGITDNKTTLIFTDYKSSLYENMDIYLSEMNNMYNTIHSKNTDILGKYGNNLVFVLNNFEDDIFSQAVLAAQLSVCDFSTYPKNTKHITHFDIDYRDVPNKSIVFYKYHLVSDYSSVEQLNNMSLTDNIYKKVLVDILVKYVVKRLDLSEFTGLLYNPYVKVQIDNKVKNIMKDMVGKVYVDYSIKQIAFNRTGIGTGNIIIDVSITPFSLLDTINIVMEV
jgi:hypothetical protein